MDDAVPALLAAGEHVISAEVLADTAPPDTSGWYRNRGQVPLTVMPDRYPSALMQPGEPHWLNADPQHPDVEPCPAPEADAATPEEA